MISRRRLLVALGVSTIATPLGSLAQKPAKVLRIGFLGSETAQGYARQIEALRAGLREYGFIEGSNLTLEYRWANGRAEGLPELASDLVRQKVDMLVTHGGPGTRAAKAATSQIPIVIATLGTDPVETGLVSSLARPGGNVTGRVSMSTQLHVKQMELIKETLPHARRIALLYSGARGENETTPKAMVEAARTLNLDIQVVRTNRPDDFETALAEMTTKRIQAMVVANQARFIAQASRVAGLAIKHRIPMIGNQEFAEAGALLGYGASILENFRRVGYFVDRIVKGANPATMPIEQPTTFELVVNMKTAKALGITFPPSVLARAERVIQ